MKEKSSFVDRCAKESQKIWKIVQMYRQIAVTHEILYLGLYSGLSGLLNE